MYTSRSLSLLYTLTFAAGILTWVVFNRRPVAGDYAVLTYACAYAALYSALRISSFDENTFATSIGLVTLYGATALMVTAAYRLSPWHPLAKFPGPRLSHVSSLWLTYVSFKGRRHLIVDRLHARYGVFVRIGPNILSINSPSAQHVYSGAARMPKHDSYRVPGHHNEVALFFRQPTDKLHSNRKRLWSPLFTKKGLSKLAPFVENRTFQLLDCLEQRQAESQSKSVDLADCFSHWAYDLMGDFVFGGCNRLEMMKNGDPRGMIEGGKLGTVIIDSVGQTPWLLDLLWRLPFRTPLHNMASTAARMMETRLCLKQPPSFRDLVSFLTEDETVPERDLLIEAIVAMQGGSDNTSINLTLAIYFTTTEPEYFHLLRQELLQVFPDPTGPLPDEKLVTIPLLDAIINESLRLGSPYFLPRVVPKGGTAIGDSFLPEGTVVALAAYSQQIDPENFYPDPLSFRPGRWLPQGLGPSTIMNKSALASFSYGPHACIGKPLAYQEMRHALARLVLNMDIQPVEDFDTKAFRDGMLNMRTTILERSFMVRVKRHGDAIPVEQST